MSSGRFSSGRKKHTRPSDSQVSYGYSMPFQAEFQISATSVQSRTIVHGYICAGYIVAVDQQCRR